jgi:hypothetical protein
MPQDWLVHHKINALVRFSPKRPADMPENVPFVNDLARTQAEKDLLTILDATGELGRPFIVAKEVPADRVKVLRAGMQAMLKDTAFLSEAQKQNLPLDPVDGEDAEDIMAKIFSAPRSLAAKVKEVLE